MTRSCSPRPTRCSRTGRRCMAATCWSFCPTASGRIVPARRPGLGRGLEGRAAGFQAPDRRGRGTDRMVARPRPRPARQAHHPVRRHGHQLDRAIGEAAARSGQPVVRLGHASDQRLCRLHDGRRRRATPGRFRSSARSPRPRARPRSNCPTIPPRRWGRRRRSSATGACSGRAAWSASWSRSDRAGRAFRIRSSGLGEDPQIMVNFTLYSLVFPSDSFVRIQPFQWVTRDSRAKMFSTRLPPKASGPSAATKSGKKAGEPTMGVALHRQCASIALYSKDWKLLLRKIMILRETPEPRDSASPRSRQSAGFAMKEPGVFRSRSSTHGV